MSEKKRVFVIPVFSYMHAKASTHRRGVIVNLKRMMPPELEHCEGLTGLFGGAVEPHDLSLRDAALRELREELALDLYPEPSELVEIEKSDSHSIFAFRVSWEVFRDETIYRLAGRCREGLFDVLLEEVAIERTPWVYLTMKGACLKALQLDGEGKLP